MRGFRFISASGCKEPVCPLSTADVNSSHVLNKTFWRANRMILYSMAIAGRFFSPVSPLSSPLTKRKNLYQELTCRQPMPLGGTNTPAPQRPYPELRIINSTYGVQLHKIYSRFFIAPCGERIAPFFYCSEENGELICNCFSVGYYPLAIF